MPANTDIFVMLDEPLAADGGAWLLQAPEQLVVCQHPAEIDAGLQAIEAAVQDGCYAAGVFAYELGYLLEPALASLLPLQRDVPLLWVGLFRHARRLNAAEVRTWLRDRSRPAENAAGYAVRDLKLSLDRAEYRQAFARVRQWIVAGDVYQINLTLKCLFAFEGDPLQLYRDLRRRQAVRCGGLIAAGEFHVLSLSPELFLQTVGSAALTRPMKGTAPRRANPQADAQQRAWLAADIKSRAENLMIVDLLRNDVGRLARTGSVRVTDLFTVETFRSLHQMTSGVAAELRDGIDLRTLLRALFPCGSVTGAPKIRAMQIIRALEPQPRGIYTGAIGMIAPGGRTFLNVAIRTLLLHADGRGEMGIGSGVVYDSDADAEFDECLLKAQFLTRPAPAFSLIETLRWQRCGGYHLLERHLARLAASAAYFAIPHDAPAVQAALASAAADFIGDEARVRLLLDEAGEISVSAQPLDPMPAVLQWALAERPVSSDDPFLYHKTTRRDHYQQEFENLRALCGCDEVLFVNERCELTEGSWTNLFIRRGSQLLTPPVSCGLLDGTLRRELLETRPDEVREAILRPADLLNADEVLLGNSVRGLLPARPCTVRPHPPVHERQA